MHRRKIALLFCLLAPFTISAADKTPATLILPGKSIGPITLDANADKFTQLGAPNFSDAGMGKIVESWYLGEKHGDKGRPFARPGEIGLRAHFNDDASKHIVSQVEVTSPKYATAEGIAPGATLESIRAKYPGIQPDDSPGVKFWPLYGAMEFFKETKLGIAFAVRKTDSVCVQISVMQPGADDSFQWIQPAAAQDYVIDDINGAVGPITLGMTSAKLTALLGKPDETRDANTNTAGSVLWRWRVPSQRKLDPPALTVYLRKLPDGAMIVDQIRVSSPQFALTDKIFPGCALKEALQATNQVAKISSNPNTHLDIYGDLYAGLLFDIRPSDSTCTAITIIPGPLAVHQDMSTRWLDLPAQPATGD